MEPQRIVVQQPKPEPFWTGVWKIALGIFFGSMLTGIVSAVLWWIGWSMLVRSVQAELDKPVAESIDEINGMILAYKAMTADEKARELDKAAAAIDVAKAFRTRRNAKAVAEWEDKAHRHEAASSAGKKTKPVR